MLTLRKRKILYNFFLPLLCLATASTLKANACAVVKDGASLQREFSKLDGKVNLERILEEYPNGMVDRDFIHEKYGVVYIHSVSSARNGTIEIFDASYGRRRLFFQESVRLAEKDSPAGQRLLRGIALRAKLVGSPSN